MTDIPEGLFPGPDVDGRPTWYGPARSIPEGWEARGGDQGRWDPADGPWIPEAIVQCRPTPLPDPAPWRTPDDDQARYVVTTVGEMRDRADLDQWQYADNDPRTYGWMPWGVMKWRDAPADLPVVVRRKGGAS